VFGLAGGKPPLLANRAVIPRATSRVATTGSLRIVPAMIYMH
jgi:hypothetical protein